MLSSICAFHLGFSLDDGEINVWNLCTQHAKAAMRRQTGQRVMAEDLGHAVKRERKQIALALEYYRAGWHDALKSEEALYETKAKVKCTYRWTTLPVATHLGPTR